MPVKVRCPSCEKVLTAPDAARGKGIRCPGCQTKVPVPAKPIVAVPKKKKAPASSSDFLANFDVSKAEDRNVRLCPKCGTEAQDEEIYCGNCGVDVNTGVLPERTRRKQAMKGPDQEEFYKGAWKDSWQFLKKNKSLAIRTTVYLLVATALQGGCLALAHWCEKTPPKLFWLVLGALISISFPGWCWFLATEIIHATMAKKDFLKRVNSDMFLNMALGLKYALWQLVHNGGIAFPIALLVLVASDRDTAVLVGQSVYTFLFLLFPIVMCHMAMPVSWKAWFAPYTIRWFFRVPGATLYFWLIAFVSMLPAALILGGAGAAYGEEAMTVIRDLRKGIIPTQEQMLQASFIVPAVALVVSMIPLGIALVYNMRVLGLIAYYFHSDMELVTKAPQPPPWEGGMRPHRGRQLVTMAALGFFLPYIGSIAYKMAQLDMERIKSRRMDPAGEKNTKLAITIGQANLIYSIILTVAAVMMWSFGLGPFAKDESRPVEQAPQDPGAGGAAPAAAGGAAGPGAAAGPPAAAPEAAKADAAAAP